MMMLMDILGTTPEVADTMISGNWIIGVLGAAGTLLGIILGHAKGKASQEVSIKDQPIQFQKNTRPVSYDQYAALDARVARLEIHLDAMTRDQAAQYKQILEAGAERELRMTEVLNHGLRVVHDRLDLLIKSSPRPRA